MPNADQGPSNPDDTPPQEFTVVVLHRHKGINGPAIKITTDHSLLGPVGIFDVLIKNENFVLRSTPQHAITFEDNTQPLDLSSTSGDFNDAELEQIFRETKFDLEPDELHTALEDQPNASQPPLTLPREQGDLDPLQDGGASTSHCQSNTPSRNNRGDAQHYGRMHGSAASTTTHPSL